MKTRNLIGLFLCVLLAGCGWHLRGDSAATNIKTLNITSAQTYGKLERALRAEMRAQHIEEGGADGLTLTILSQDLRQNLLAYSDSINAAMFEIELTTHFTVTNAKGETIIPPNMERVVRPYEPNSDRALATDRETALRKEDAYRDMAANILRRINFIAGKKEHID